MSQIVKKIGKGSKVASIVGKFTLQRRTDTTCYFEIQPPSAFMTYLGMDCGPVPVRFGIGPEAKLQLRVGTLIYPVEIFTAPEAQTVNNVAFNCQWDLGNQIKYKLRVSFQDKTIRVMRQGIRILQVKFDEADMLRWPEQAYAFDQVNPNKGRNTVDVADLNTQTD